MEEENLEGILKTLKKSPMFNLSLSDKELFHSNMLAWIFERYPVFFRSLFDIKEEIELISVEREQNNFDLFITYKVNDKKEKYILIENKVKSIPTQKQLAEYKDKNESPKSVEEKMSKNDKKVAQENERKAAEYRQENTKYVLLSLVKPFWIENKEESWNGWSYLSYQRVAEKLQECVDIQNFEISDQNESSYHKSLIEDYVKYLEFLEKTIKSISKEKLYLPKKSNHSNNISKRFSSQLHRWRAEIHKKELFEKIYKKSESNSMLEKWWLATKCDIGKFYLGSDFSDKGLKEVLDYKMIIHVSNAFKQIVKRNKKIEEIDVLNVFVFGMQIEGDAFRIVLESSRENCFAKIKEFFSKDESIENSNLWFDIIDVSDLVKSKFVPVKLQGRKNKDRINGLNENETMKYGNSFIYKYFTIDEGVKKEAVYEAIYSIHTKLIEALDDKNSELNKFKSYLVETWVNQDKF